jgi:methyl-accepting chemotaxis protein
MFKNIKLSSKIIGGFIFVATITLIVGVIGWFGVSTMSKDVNEIGEVRLPSVSSLLNMKAQQNYVLIAERGIINKETSSTKELRTAHYTAIENAFKEVDNAWKEYEALPQTKEEAALVSKLVPQLDSWKKKHEEVINVTKQIDTLMDSGVDINDNRISVLYHQANVASLDARQYFLDSQSTLNQIIKLNEDIGNDSVVSSEKESYFATVLSIIAIIIGVIVALTFGILLSRSITKPMLFAVS